MQDELLDLQQRLEKTIIFVTHDLDEALKLGDRIALMKDGEIVQIGTPRGDPRKSGRCLCRAVRRRCRYDKGALGKRR